jgi:hypothetical protein
MDYYSSQNSGCRIRQFTHRGHDLLSLENSLIRITLLLDKGGDIIEFTYKPKDLDFLLKRKDGLNETAKQIDSSSQISGAYFDYYPEAGRKFYPAAVL